MTVRLDALILCDFAQIRDGLLFCDLAVRVAERT